MRVLLQTSWGDEVVRGVLPTFESEPGVIIWGQRMFTYSDTVMDDAGDYWIYKEAFIAVLARADGWPAA